MGDSNGLIWQITIVALIAAATAWLSRSGGDRLPETRRGGDRYRVKLAWQVVGIAASAFCLVLVFHSLGDMASAAGIVSFVFFLATAVVGIWAACGVIVTDGVGITKRVLWSSCTLRWNDITELRRHDKDGGGIEIRAGSRSIVVDSRFRAVEHLWRRVIDEADLNQTSEKVFRKR